MSFESLNSRVRSILEDAGVKTAVQALQLGKEGLTDISGIGDATADQILATAEAELAGAAGETPAPAPTVEPGVNTSNKDAEEAGLDDDDESDADFESRPAEVVLRLNTLASAIVGGSRILQGESRRVPFAQFETAVAEYPGAWLVRFRRDGEFEVA